MTDDEFYTRMAQIASDANLVIPLENMPAVAAQLRQHLNDDASSGVVADYLRALSRQKPLVTSATSSPARATEVLPISEDGALHNPNFENESQKNDQ